MPKGEKKVAILRRVQQTMGEVDSQHRFPHLKAGCSLETFHQKLKWHKTKQIQLIHVGKK